MTGLLAMRPIYHCIRVFWGFEVWLLLISESVSADLEEILIFSTFWVSSFFIPLQDDCKTRKNTKYFITKQVPNTKLHKQWEQSTTTEPP